MKNVFHSYLDFAIKVYCVSNSRDERTIEEKNNDAPGYIIEENLYLDSHFGLFNLFPMFSLLIMVKNPETDTQPEDESKGLITKL